MLTRYRSTYGVRHAALYLRCKGAFGCNGGKATDNMTLWQ